MIRRRYGEANHGHPDHPRPDSAQRRLAIFNGAFGEARDGALPLPRLRELLGTGEAFPGEASGAAITLAGFVLHQLGRIPSASDKVDWNGYRFEVVDMDRNRVDRVLVAPLLP